MAGAQGPTEGGRARLVTADDLLDARRRVAAIVRATPTSHVESVAAAAGAPLWLKEEQRQRTGSFKIRGAYNHVCRLPAGTPVVAASAGNHAQGVALAAARCGMPAVIYMPAGASLPKVIATSEYGAEVRLVGEVLEDAVAAAREHAERTGARLIPPFDDPHVIAGQGTLGLELLEECPDLDTVLVPVGGGGLLAGVAAAIKLHRPSVRVVGVEAEGAASMRASLDAGEPVALTSVHTIADGIAVKSPSALTLAHAQAFVDDVVTVTDEQLGEALVVLLERAKAVVEPSGVAGVAAVLAGTVTPRRADAPIVAVLSGGNVDPLLLSRLIEHGLSGAGRYLRLRVDLPDRPGSLARLAADVGALGLNILSVDHHRERASLDVDEVEIRLTVETRGGAHRTEALRSLRERGWRVRAY